MAITIFLDKCQGWGWSGVGWGQDDRGVAASVGVEAVLVLTYLILAPVGAADVSWCLHCSWDHCCFQHNENSRRETKAAIHYLSVV